MTIVPYSRLMPEEVQHLGNNIAEAIRLDHEELALDRSLAALGEQIQWDHATQGDNPCD